jgi:cephalosporin hydroxylase
MSKNPVEQFAREVQDNIEGLAEDKALQRLSNAWIRDIAPHKYAYNFRWMGRPIIQFPQDTVAMQEIIWAVQPELIIETGIAHGGSLIFSASMLELNAASGGPREAEVLGIDIDIRPHNRAAIEAHPMSRRISMIQGSSIDPAVISQVRKKAEEKHRVLVCLDSNHTHEHVLAELKAYGPLTSVGSYCVVFDTVIEDMPDDMYPDRPWGVGNNPKTAVRQFLKTHPEFEVDRSIDHKILITVAPEGFLKRVR